MAVDRLQLVRQEISRFLKDDATPSLQSAQVNRRQRWHDCSAMSELCAQFACHVSEVQTGTFDTVFARQLTAYKLVLIHQSNPGHASLVSFVDRHTKFSLGRKAVSNHGFVVAMNVEEILQSAGVEAIVARVTVSGVGVRLGNHNIFPEMTPIAIAYLWQ
ncbi:hypothetical protein ABBQ32_003853 [Trebouxia sp. C0010 RCD-2024]